MAEVEPGSAEGVWKRFADATAGKPPWPHLVQAADLAGGSGEALDLGCGAGRDTAHLLERGFHVTAVDSEPELRATLAHLPGVEVVVSGFEDFQFGSYDLINAQNSLPFLAEPQFTAVIGRAVAALRSGGVFSLSLFGPHDTWNVPGAAMTFTDRDEILHLLEGLDIVAIEEEDRDGVTALGETKHWHLFRIIARRP